MLYYNQMKGARIGITILLNVTSGAAINEVINFEKKKRFNKTKTN